MKTPIAVPAAKVDTASAERQNPRSHIRLPQRSDQVEGDEADIASVSPDSRTATQDPVSKPKP